MKRQAAFAALVAVWIWAQPTVAQVSAPAVGTNFTPAVTELTMDQLVVTATGWEKRLAETAPAITVVTAEEIERRQLTTIADALRNVPGVDVAARGSRGGTTGVFLRGANSDQVLVLLDGIEVNSTTAGTFDFANLTTENVERIEVVRGWGGTLYGSEAIGGVIQVFTRRGEGPPRGSISVAGGNASTDREVAEVSGRNGLFSYSGSVSHIHTEGFQRKNDDYENTVISARVGVDVTEATRADLSFRASASDFGNFFSNNFLGAPDPNARVDDALIATRGEWSHEPLPGLRYRLGVSYSRDDLKFYDPPDPAETAIQSSDFLTEVLTVDGRTSLSWLGGHAESILGIEYDSKSADVESVFDDPVFGSFPSAFDETIDTIAGYGLQQFFFVDRTVVVTGGVRIDDNDRFGSETSPSAGASWLLPTGTRLRATYAESFKAPSLNELFFPGFGNEDVGAETSREVTVGFDQSVSAARLTFSTSFFHREINDLIEGVPDLESGLLLAANVGEAEIDGVEVALAARLCEGIHAGGSYTWLAISGGSSSRVRRPRHSGSLYLTAEHEGLVRKRDRLAADVRLLLVGDRSDFDPETFTVVENSAYQRLDLALSWGRPLDGSFLRRFSLFVRVENLLDLDYDEVLGFDALPLNVLAGVRVEL